MVQYLNWYHEPEMVVHDSSSNSAGGSSIGYGERRLLKTGIGSNDPYMHTIDAVMHSDFGRYACVIANVMGERECSAYLTIRSGAMVVRGSSISMVFALSLLLSLVLYFWN